MISTTEFKNGETIVMDGQLWVIVEFQHVKPGKGGAFVRTKLRRLKGHSVMERTFRVGEKFEEAFIEQRTLQFQYRSGETFHFMDLASYEGVEIPESVLGPSAGFLKENMDIAGSFYAGEIISLELRIFVDLRIDETEPGLRGDTSKSGNKPAKLETGLVIQVPLFMDSGEIIRVDTRTGAYVSRA